ncbi:MAG: leucyl aminopeptidase [Actinomycetota bacterium]|nr:leucyl aminopeptidase [Actinomycetota bacterium]
MPPQVAPPQVAPPQVSLAASGPLDVDGADVVALPVTCDADGLSLGAGADAMRQRLGTDLLLLLDRAQVGGAAGEVVEYPVLDGGALQRVLLVGVGSGSTTDLRRAGAAVARGSRGHGLVASSVTAVADDAGLRAYVEGLVLGSFGFHRRSTGPEWTPAERVVLALSDGNARADALERGLATARAGWRARAMAITPSNEKNPEVLAEWAAELAAEAGLERRVWDEEALAADGFGGLLGVGQGSVSPPRLIRLDYTPRRTGRQAAHVVLVGKGITFDTGGLSIKPREFMVNMKRDMTGGAVVLATMAALPDLDVPLRVTGLVAAAENSVSGSALRPGDVVRHYNGRTSEVLNTDAEGRLVLADALAYAVAELRPDAVVDVATLTGAVKTALGFSLGGLYATDDALAEALLSAGTAAGEPLWRLPLAADYEDLLESPVADANNAPGGPGSITAALFLEPFTGGLPWAHLDVASVGDAPEDRFEWSQGPTGFGARALLHWLETADPLAGVGTAGVGTAGLGTAGLGAG